jgi:hypothetical protein
MIGIGLKVTGMRRRGNSDPFATLMSSLSAGSAQLIAHPLEYGSLYQDRAGTTLVTASGQTVGLALDWGVTGLAPMPGAQIIPSTNLSEFSPDNAMAVQNEGSGVTRIPGGGLSVNMPGVTASYVSLSSLTFADNTYHEVTVTVSNYVSGQLRIRLNTGVITTIAAGNGTFKLLVQSASATSSSLQSTAAAGGFVGDITFLSVRGVLGCHAEAISDAARGIFRDVGGFKWIEWNGTNTAYQTPVLPAPGVDKAQMFAGARKLSDAGRGVLAELSPTIASNNGALGLFAPNSAAADAAFESKGTTLRDAIGAGLASPVNAVLSGLGDISGDIATLRANGAQVDQDTGDQGSDNYNPSGSYRLFYGARAGTTVFFNGRTYGTLGPITRFSATNATSEQIAAAEAYFTAVTEGL